MLRKALIALPFVLLLIGALSWLLFRDGGNRGPAGVDETSSAVAKKQGGGVKESIPASPERRPILLLPRGKEAAAGLLSGTVLNVADHPVAGARVIVLPADNGRGFEVMMRARILGQPTGAGQALGQGISGADGHYQVAFESSPEPGEYRVSVRSPGYVPLEENWWNTGEPTIMDFHLEDGGESIEGIVLDLAAQTPLAGARVEVSSEDESRGFGGFGRFGNGGGGGEIIDRDVADAEGKFRLSVGPGLYRIAARAEGHSREEARSIEAGSKDVRISLGPARGISGRVIDEAGSPVVAAQVTVYSEDDGGFRGPPQGRRQMFFRQPAGKAETGEDGQFKVLDLSLTGYLLEARKGGFEVGQKSGKLPAEGEGTPVEVVLKPGGILSGTVKDEAGAPVASAMVLVRNDAEADRGGAQGRQQGRRNGQNGQNQKSQQGRGGRRGGGASGSDDPGAGEAAIQPINLFQADAISTTDEGGRFVFDTLARSTYSISVTSESHVPHLEGGIEVQEKAEVDLVVDSGITLLGRVIERPGGAAVPRASIRLRIGDTDRKNAQSDAEGKFRIRGLAAGQIREVQVQAQGHSVLFAENLEIAPEPKEQTQDFEIDSSASIAGQVVSTKGDPVPRAVVRVAAALEDPGSGGGPGGTGGGPGGGNNRARFDQMRRVQSTERSGRTDSNGEFLIANVSAGNTYQVVVTHPDYHELRSDPFSVEAGAKIEGQLYKLKAGGRMVVWVTDEAGAPIANARVDVSRQRPEDQSQAPAQGQGGRGNFQNFMARRLDRQSRSTSPEGKAMFSGFDAGLYTVESKVNGYQPFKQADVSVADDQDSQVAAKLLPENTITGLVVDSAGQPIAGARLRVSEQPEADGGGGFQRGGGFGGFGGPGGPGNPLSTFTTDKDGAFRLGNLGAGPYQVMASADGFAAQTLDSIEVNKELEIKLQHLGAISGQVLIAETGEPVTAFTVSLLREGQRGPGRQRGGQGGGPGGLASGAAGDQGGAGGGQGGPGRRQGGGGGGPGGGFGGPGGGGPGGGGPGGGGPGGGGRGGRGGRGQQTLNIEDAQGLFSFADVEPGSWVVEVSAQDLPSRQVTAKVQEGSSIELKMLLFANIVVSGVVVDQGTNMPVAGAQVMVLPTADTQAQPVADASTVAQGTSGATSSKGQRGSGRPSRQSRSLSTSTTDDDGAFYARDLVPGKYNLVVVHDDFKIAQKGFEIRDDGLTQEIRVPLDVGEKFTGMVTETNGQRSVGLFIRFRDSNGYQKTTQTDELGRFEIRGLEPKTSYSVSISDGQGGRSILRDSVTIKNGENRKNFKLPAE
jgi:protocatechuate 3,4-dioxygenase beta subunit